MIPATAAERFEFDARFQGETLHTLAQLLDIELPKTGPYRFSFHTQVADGRYTLTALEGTLKDIEPWKAILLETGLTTSTHRVFRGSKL